MPSSRHHKVRMSATARHVRDRTRKTVRAKTELFIGIQLAIRVSSFDLLRVHFVDLTVQSSAANSKLLRRGGDVSVRRCERLHDEPLLGLMKIERARFFSKRLGRSN